MSVNHYSHSMSCEQYLVAQRAPFTAEGVVEFSCLEELEAWLNEFINSHQDNAPKALLDLVMAD